MSNFFRCALTADIRERPPPLQLSATSRRQPGLHAVILRDRPGLGCCLPGSPPEIVETSVTVTAIAVEINTAPKAVEFVLNAPADVFGTCSQSVEAHNEAATLGGR